jgi:hypothetical protein
LVSGYLTSAGWGARIMSFCAGTCHAQVRCSSRDHPDAVALADPVTLGIGGCGVDLVEVVLDAARDGDQLQPGGPARGPEPVRVPVGQEAKLPAAAPNASPPRRMDSSPSRM